MKRLPDSFRPAAWPSSLTLLLRFALGITIGFFLHYLLYRLSLPAEPFIYAAF
jgi:hypothetical protein